MLCRNNIKIGRRIILFFERVEEWRMHLIHFQCQVVMLKCNNFCHVLKVQRLFKERLLTQFVSKNLSNVLKTNDNGHAIMESIMIMQPILWRKKSNFFCLSFSSLATCADVSCSERLLEVKGAVKCGKILNMLLWTCQSKKMIFFCWKSFSPSTQKTSTNRLWVDLTTGREGKWGTKLLVRDPHPHKAVITRHEFWDWKHRAWEDKCTLFFDET